ncbi:MAG: OmpA family protein [Bacteroidaceae bacterium]|nr:OmpA family protein [Bacteroidaceae bacterium]
MKKFMISLALASFAMFSTAQETASEVVVPTKSKSVVTNSFGSNWFVGVNGGVNFYNGVFMNGENIFDHMSPALDVYVGKWHTPGFGWRVAYRGLNIQTYEKFDHTAFMNFHFDAMFNLRNLILGYSKDRVWEITPYVGVGWAGRWGMDHEKGKGRMTSGAVTGSLSANYGIINSWSVSKRWAINLELAGAFFRNGFSGINGQSGHDMMWTAAVGVSCNLGKVGWDNAPDVDALQAIYVGMIDGLQGQLDDALAANKEKQNQIKALEEANKALEGKVEELSKVKPISVSESIFFSFDSYKIASKKEELNIKAYAEAAKAAGVKVKVVGFADKVGSDEYNNKLSAKRAEAVAEIIRSYGVEVEVVPGGESEEYKERMLNRRAIITVAE